MPSLDIEKEIVIAVVELTLHKRFYAHILVQLPRVYSRVVPLLGLV